MRRQGPFADSGPNAYAAAQMQHISGQRLEHKSHFQGQLEAFTPEREQPYETSKGEGQWRWERDGSKVSNPVFNDGQGVDASKSYFQSQRPDPNLGLEKQNNPRSQLHGENVEVGYDDNLLSLSFDSLEQKFLDDIMKLAKEQNDAEDAENARHREKINMINAKYQDQLAALRVQHASRRDEFLRKESHVRQQLYQKAMIDQYPNSGMPPGNPHGYSGMTASASMGDAPGPYNSDHFDSYGERARFLGGTRDHGVEPRGPYPGGRVYNTGSRYY